MWFDGSSPVKELLWIASRMDWVSSMQPHPGFPFRAAMDPVVHQRTRFFQLVNCLWPEEEDETEARRGGGPLEVVATV